MDQLGQYFGDLYRALPEHPRIAAGLLLLCSAICGVALGYERERKRKPAGMRTLSLICVGSTVFTLGSLLLATNPTADRTRVAAQIVTGVGFLGAGTIIRHRGTVLGMTTGATVWTSAAIGLLIGSGYAAGGIAVTGLVLVMLTLGRRVERQYVDPCEWTTCRLTYRTANGKTRLRVLELLDRCHAKQDSWNIEPGSDTETIALRCCTSHRHHRTLLYRLANLPDVLKVDAPNLGCRS